MSPFPGLIAIPITPSVTKIKKIERISPIQNPKDKPILSDVNSVMFNVGNVIAHNTLIYDISCYLKNIGNLKINKVMLYALY